MHPYTNGTGVPLSVAVFLATDHYDYDPSAISASALLKPVRQAVLATRVPKDQAQIDVLGLLKSRMGTAIHSSIELAWTHHYVRAMGLLGYPDSVIDRVVINPEDPSTLPKDALPVYMERRSYRELDGQRISGKFDFVAEGRLEDFKSTSTFTWVHDTKSKDHQLQGSIYRWLNPDIITEDYLAIQYIFTDWSPGRTNDPSYPGRPTEQKLIPLLSIEDTEAYIRSKLRAFEQYRKTPEEQIPLCTDEELWRKAPQFKYYKNPLKMSRSTKNFDTASEAYTRLAEDKSVGLVVEVPGQVVACKYCSAFPVCTQKDRLIADGSLII